MVDLEENKETVRAFYDLAFSAGDGCERQHDVLTR
jgi:hypothetical protein